MAKIGISLNEVFRDLLGQFEYVYSKYIKEIEIKKDQIQSFDLKTYFDFKTDREINTFLFDEASLEIFGHADQLYDNLMTHFNTFLVDIDDEEEHTIEIVSREAFKSIPATLFFLSKLGCRANNIRFVKQNEDEWGDLDVLITANPVALENKPENKISIKINAPYNKTTKSDFELDSIITFFKDESLRNKILNTKITTHKIID